MKRKRSESGMSTVQVAVIATMVALAAAGTSSIMVSTQRQAKTDQFRYNYNLVASRADSLLRSVETLKSTGNYNPGLGTANTMFHNCLQDDGDGIKDCYEAPSNMPLGYEDFKIRNVLNEFVVGDAASGASGFKADGTPCTNVTFSDCYFSLKFYVKPVCGFGSGTSFSCGNGSGACCEVADHFDITYQLAPAGNPPRAYNGIVVAAAAKTVSLKPADINQALISKIPACDNSKGHVPIGVNQDGTFKCGVLPRNTHVVAHHFLMTAPPPAPCQFTVTRADGSTYAQQFTDLLPATSTGARHSFAGMWINPRAGVGVDLGGSGSCINNSGFTSDFYSNCSESGCAYATSHDNSIWLRALNKSTPQTDNLGPDMSFISSCAVCEIDGPLLVVHQDAPSSFQYSPPACPAGYDRLYVGRSLASMSLHAGEAQDVYSGYNAGQDRASIGSCIRMNSSTRDFVNVEGNNDSVLPFLQGNQHDSSFSIGFRTDWDHALYYGAKEGDTSYASYCSVCWKPPRAQDANPNL